MKKIRNILLALLVILASVVPYNIISAESGRDISSMVDSNITQYLLKGETLTHDNRQGAVSVDWKLKEGTEFKAGDYFELVFDQELLTMAPTSFDMVGADGSVEGTCSVDNTTGKLKCTFIQDSKDSHSHQGGFTHTFSIKENKVKNDGSPTDIEFSIGGKPNKITVGSIDGSIIGSGESRDNEPTRKFGDLDLENSTQDSILINWTIGVNEQGTNQDDLILGNVKIEDKLSPGHEYVVDEEGKIKFSVLKIYDQDRNSDEVYDIDQNTVNLNDDGFSLNVNLPRVTDDGKDLNTVLIRYQTKITDMSFIDYSNTVKVTNDSGKYYEATKTVKLDYSQWFDKITDPAMNGKIRIKKMVAGTDIPIEGVSFDVYVKGHDEPYITVTTDENGEAVIENKEGYKHDTYYFKEVSAPDFVEFNPEIKYEFEFSEEEGREYKVFNKEKKTSILASKVWQDHGYEEYRHDVKLNLLQNGNVIDSVTLSEGNWTHEFKDLPAIGKDGKAYEYKIEEENLSDRYTNEIKEFENVVIVVNKFKPIEKLSVEKKWILNEGSSKTDSINVEIYRNSELEPFKIVELSDKNDWKFETIVDKYDDQGALINYRVVEQDVEGFIATVEQNDYSFTITNEAINNDIVISGTKTWINDNERFRPDSITVELHANGNKIDEQTVTKESNWTYEFKELAEFDKDGKKIIYTIKEADVKGYESKVNGFDLENTLKDLVSVEGKKIWQDNDARADRPDSIEVELLANGKVIADTKVTEDTNWEYKFENLHKYDKTGEEINYSIKERAVNGYVVSYDGNDIINTRNEQFNMTVNKEWVIENSDAEKAPITIILSNNNGFEKEVTISEEDNWTYVFEYLEMFDESGKKLEYSLAEKDLDGFTSQIIENDNGFTVINTANPTEPEIPEENPVEPTEPEEPPVEEPEIPVEPPVEEPEIPVEPPVEEPEIPVEPPVEEPEIPVEPPVEEPEIPVEPPVEEPEIPEEPTVEEPEEPEVEEVLGVSRDPQTPKEDESLPEVEEVLAANRPPVLPQTGMGFSNSVKFGFALLVSGLALVLKKKED